MTLGNIISIFSMLFGSGLLLSLWKYFRSRVKRNEKKTDAVCIGVQALLRDRLIDSYNHYEAKGYAPIYARENFENMYNQYHALGGNGVMEDLARKFKDLPISKED